ncbi:aminotransferase class V-fold PLP-dependent enzyme [Microbacterium sp. M3]|uniref:Aminotransferase class V-fold PLP-dependent enzyme n=1 Tax=Microbacterium arthrosphaerae TaxID=792652 RepID=A0ABU4H331_9MICO|nr:MULTISPECIES: aminotransferase class V-fold PLP-dependent enzyme [Microbacterium]MDW4573080.1 aminotransferase class V-fold PLP-dependent enzyme [Microbacterium arthrosphaerae]MDW7606935.1 aminotransferase class V-fold PLP-dependent enzyme [Microbacterium sp. M3]
MGNNTHDQYRTALDRAHAHAQQWLDTVAERPVRPELDADGVLARLDRALPEQGTDAAAVVDELAEAAEPGLMAIGSPRFYGFVMGGTYPAALAADWLVSAWDQNTGSRQPTPATAAVEEVAGDWLVDLLGLRAGSGVGFATGATMANLSCLVVARDAVIRAHGADPAAGLQQAPPVRFLAGDAVHTSVVLAGRLSGLGVPITVGADDQGRIDVAGLERALDAGEGPAVVALQAGDVHSGCFDDFAAAVEVARRAGAWVHVDGAFGLWAAASPRLEHLVRGLADADSWATDAHKTLNVPYDCGVAIVRDEAAMTASLGAHAAYLPAVASIADPYDHVPELSRRARGVPVWAALRSLGRRGVVDLVDGLADAAAALAAGFAEIPGLEVLNDVVFTQVCLATADDATTAALGEWLRAEGTAWASSSTWQGRTVVRFAVSNHGTDAEAVRRTVDAVRRGALALGIGAPAG